ncbi:MAG: transaldolase family protein [Micrococcales bacterium]|nr:transaldolase family protein [Micrococcales bacterium]
MSQSPESRPPAAGGAPKVVAYRLAALNLPVVAGEETYVERVQGQCLDGHEFATLTRSARHLGVTAEFKRVVDYFQVPAGHTPAGFAVELALDVDGVLRADLVRNISYDTDSQLRPTNVLFSADTANPYELAHVAPLLANLTCNPGIIYDRFLNNPKANVDGHFKDRDEVVAELGRILGPGCDISVELNNPFDPSFDRLLEEAEHFRQLLSEWRLVIKVPHTGPVNAQNVAQLLGGDKRLDCRYTAPATEDAFIGHRLALALREHGFRINFTLMFEPYQAQLALQARPYFINSFVRQRLIQTQRMAALLGDYRAGGDESVLAELRDYLIASDYLTPKDIELDLGQIRDMAQGLVDYRQFDSPEGSDGLDAVRHNLRLLRQANLPDTRLIICSMAGDSNYPDIDRLLAADEFADMTRRVVVTAEPSYLARFASTSQVISYQRSFMSAVQGVV